jgi:hypothetical protein
MYYSILLNEDTFSSFNSFILFFLKINQWISYQNYEDIIFVSFIAMTFINKNLCVIINWLSFLRFKRIFNQMIAGNLPKCGFLNEHLNCKRKDKLQKLNDHFLKLKWTCLFYRYLFPREHRCLILKTYGYLLCYVPDQEFFTYLYTKTSPLSVKCRKI